jgi:hypothetical protein
MYTCELDIRETLSSIILLILFRLKADSFFIRVLHFEKIPNVGSILYTMTIFAHHPSHFGPRLHSLELFSYG